VRIVDIRETVVPIKSEIRNAYIDFSQMTVSVLALVTDVMRQGKPVVGFGFNSNGRYAPSGLLRDRFIPRLRAAEPRALVDEGGENLDPVRVWDVVMRNEKPGGHGERSVAVGVLDMAVWDAVAKIAGLPLYRLLADRFRGGHFDDKVFVYAAGGYYYPDKDLSALQNEMQGYLDLGYSVVKMKIGGAPLSEDLRRIETVLKILKTPEQLAVDANGRFDWRMPSRTRRHSPRTGCAGMRKQVIRWTINCKPSSRIIIRDPWRREKTYSPCRTHEISFAMRRCDQIATSCSSIARLSYGLVEYLRILGMLKEYGWSPVRCVPHGGHQMSLNIAAGLGLGGNESYPGIFQPFGDLPTG